MKRKAFTLIELLIVVLIIAILAAIAIPNFMEFQTRAKVSRLKADMRTIATGLEAYCVDEGAYPLGMYEAMVAGLNLSYQGYQLNAMSRLTTPIAYLSSIPRDPFTDETVDLAGTGGSHSSFFEFQTFCSEFSGSGNS
jgi:type II secretion system protein G